MRQEEDFYWQSNSEPTREEVFPRHKRYALILRVVIATVSVISVFIALEVVLTIHGILYDNNTDPGGNTHFNLNVVFVLFVFFVVLANVLYNRKR